MSGVEQQPQQPDYSTWSTESLISRITELERQLHTRTAEFTAPSPAEPAPVETKRARKYSEDDITHTPANKPRKQHREIDPSKYHTRFIALKFAYLGQRYNGLEHANNNVTPLPTVEEELYKALRKTRLIFPNEVDPDEAEFFRGPRPNKAFSINWEGCDYSKAGRTDRGVSAFGQVVGIRVRSSRPKRKEVELDSLDATMKDGGEATATATAEPAVEDKWDDIADEITYVSLLNRVLPEDIRVLAWCPNPPEGFDARFSCRERQYKYFFTQPAFSPTPGPFGFDPMAHDKTGTMRPKFREGWLDIDAMREAAKYYEGVHDFRNFCKLDTSKQIENFERIIYHSDIEHIDPKSTPLGYVSQPGFQALQDGSEQKNAESADASSSSAAQVYVFNLKGSAFLWHQVRHMVSILFLVGQGLEPPTIVRDLLDVNKNPRKPIYEMASDAPLVLWDCIFPDLKNGGREDALEWVYAGDRRQIKSHYSRGDGKYGLGGVVDGLWSVWRQRKIDEILAGVLLDRAVSQGDQTIFDVDDETAQVARHHRGQRVFYGANEPKGGGPYVSVMQKRKGDLPAVQNARWLAAKQRKIAAKEAESGRMEM
ncbi:pseudouridine synthase [Aspergillus avenaceus]|uniref:Pseudouridine synthase n=1 Tax=Aspergillus avenaceus TaxID=36643 RepID=A0A5N6TTP0_ASPAV|nr:pseudouridine synthase [Aspergillus avenaceus]